MKTAKYYRERKWFNNQRDAVLKRDDYKCVGCGADLANGYKLRENVHHMDGEGRGKESPHNDISNLVTLCKSCHAKLHAMKIADWAIGIIAKHWDEPNKAMELLNISRQTLMKYRNILWEQMRTGSRPSYCKSRTISTLHEKLMNKRVGHGGIREKMLESMEAS